MRVPIRLRAAIAAVALVLGVAAGPAASAQIPDPSCHDAGLLSGKLITDICWECLFPLRLFGATLGAGGSVPARAAREPLCLCFDGLGVPQPGGVLSLWEPARIAEIVKTPGCMPSLGGIRIPTIGRRAQGTRGDQLYDIGDKAFYHYHLYAFPLLVMFEFLREASCVKDGYLDFDLIYLSELDPTWNVDELALFLNPETALLANPAAIAACLVDASATMVGDGLDELFWCAGSWGHLYPLVGTHTIHTSMPRVTSLLATRALATMHRRGLAWRTMGSDTLCEGRIDPFLPKTQYRMSMFWPVAQARSNHPIGRSTLIWGLGREIPGSGEDAVYVIWRWNDCCATF